MPSPTTRPASTRAVQAEQTRQQILETAQRLFAAQGYDATSLQMIADELGLTKAAVYYHFHAKADILHAVMSPDAQRIDALLDGAEQIRGRRARVEYLVNGLVEFLIEHRHQAVLGSTDPVLKREKSRHLATAVRARGLALLFGDNPTGAERLAYRLTASLPDGLPELVDLSDDELREVLRSAALRLLRV